MKQTTPKDTMNVVREVLPVWVCVIGVSCLGCLLLGDIKAVYSIIFGGCTSLLALKQLMEDQYHILVKKQRRRVFFSFIFRLALYALPIIIGLKFPNYFKFWIILIFLFSSQVIFIIKELIVNYKHYKKRMKEDG